LFELWNKLTFALITRSLSKIQTYFYQPNETVLQQTTHVLQTKLKETTFTNVFTVCWQVLITIVSAFAIVAISTGCVMRTIGAYAARFITTEPIQFQIKAAFFRMLITIANCFDI
jgi:hypothetical protein